MPGPAGCRGIDVGARRYTVGMRWRELCAAVVGVVVLALGAGAQGKKPEPQKKKASSTFQDAKDGANEALNDLDRGIHKAIPPVKKAANDTLQAIDDTLHGRKR